MDVCSGAAAGRKRAAATQSVGAVAAAAAGSAGGGAFIEDSDEEEAAAATRRKPGVRKGYKVHSGGCSQNTPASAASLSAVPLYAYMKRASRHHLGRL